MKVLAKTKPEVGIWMDDAPIPEIGHNDVRIKIHKTAICGTVVHIYHLYKWAHSTIPLPITIVPDFMGEVGDLGSGVRGSDICQMVLG